MQLLVISSKEKISKITVFDANGKQLDQFGVDIEVPDDATPQQFGSRYAEPAFACIKIMRENRNGKTDE